MVHDRDGEPELAIVALLTDDGRRAWGTITDGDDMQGLMEEEGCGRKVRVTADGTGRAAMSDPITSDRTTIAAPPDVVYALVADLSRMGEWSPETYGHHVAWAAPPSLVAAHGFVAPTATACTDGAPSARCSARTPGRELAWESRLARRPVAVWRYTFEPDGSGGTRVTETSEDRRRAVFRALGGVASGVSDRRTHNAESMRVTLERIKTRQSAKPRRARPRRRAGRASLFAAAVRSQMSSMPLRSTPAARSWASRSDQS